jgi:hypothetical protein
VLGVLERAKAGNPSGNPVVVTVPVGTQEDGRQSQLDLRRTSKAPLGRRVVSHFFSVGCRFESCRSAKPQVSALSAWICLLWWQSLSFEGCLESALGPGFGSACECMALGEGRGPRGMGAWRDCCIGAAAFLVDLRSAPPAAGISCFAQHYPRKTRVTGALAGRLGKATTEATLGRQGRSRWLVHHNRRHGHATACEPSPHGDQGVRPP